MQFSIPLPDQPSELLQAAVDRLKECESEGVEVWMDDWVRGSKAGCVKSVCLGGALLLRGGAPLSSMLCLGGSLIDHVEIETRTKLAAVNSFRQGRVVRGLVDMGLHAVAYASLQPQVPVVRYEDNREGFYRSMNEVIECLQLIEKNFGLNVGGKVIA